MNPDDPDKIDSENGAIDGMIREFARTGAASDDQPLIDLIESAIDQSMPKDSEVSPWLFGRYFWSAVGAFAAIFVLFLGLPGIKNYTQKAVTTELLMVSQSRFVPGGEAIVRGLIRNGKEQWPLKGQVVKANLVAENGQTIELGEAVSDSQGIIFISTTLPAEMGEGSYTLQLLSDDDISVEKSIPVQRSFRTLLSTDKPMYQPGQIIHMRALSLSQDGLMPATGREVKFEIRDPKGNKVFGKKEQTSEYGIAATDFQLANQVNEGNYTIAVKINDTLSEQTVTVSRYTLPKFKIDIATDRSYYAPADSVQITVDTQYTFGQPVVGAAVKIEADEYIEKFQTFQSLTGKTDENGQLTIRLPLKDAFVGQRRNKSDAFVRLNVVVTDQANHQRKATKQFTVTDQPIRIEVFPESGELVQYVENKVYLVTAYPDGSPAKTMINLGGEDIETSEMGIATIGIKPTKDRLKLILEATDAKGLSVMVIKQLRVGEKSQDVLLRTDRAIYDHGQSIELDVFSATPSRRVFIDVVKNGRSLSTQTIKLANGRGQLVIDASANMIGTLQIQAYSIDASGEMVRDTKVVQINRTSDLNIEATLDKQTYRPAEKAVIKFLVTNADGIGTQSALSLAAVDEAVFALQQHRPGMEEVYFLIQEEILKPRYQFTTFPGRPMTGNSQDDDLDEIQEADIIIYSGSAGTASSPETANSESFETRNFQLERNKRLTSTRLLSWLPWLPVSLMVFCVIGLSCFTVKQLASCQTSQVRSESKWVNQFRWNMRWVFWAYLAAISLPVFELLFVGAMGLRLSTEQMLAAYCVSFLVGLVVLFVLIKKTVETLPILTNKKVVSRCLYSLIWVSILTAVAFIMILCFGEAQLLITLGLLVVCVAVSSSCLLIWWLGFSGERSLISGLWAWLWRCSLFGFILILPILAATSLKYSDFNDAASEAKMINSTVDATMEPESERASSGVRKFFPETLLWQPQLITDQNGFAELEIPLADSITTWRVSGSAVSKSGELGSLEKGIRVFQDFFIDIDFPVELTQGDEVNVPVAIYNYLDREQSIEIDIRKADWFELINGADSKQTLVVPANSVSSAVCQLRALKPGVGKLTVYAQGEDLADAVERSVRIKPNGERIETVVNGRLDQEKLNKTLRIPENAIAGGNDLLVKIYPGAFSQVVEGLSSIFRMPYGCFEQTSSTTYPNVLTLNYMQDTGQASPELEAKALNFINIGYQRLISYEVDGGGFSWFGEAPANTVLTAYGLMQFADMSQVYEVDPELIDRTRKWLLAQRNANGTWSSPVGGIAEGAINKFQGEQTLRTTAYIAWVVSQVAGQQEVDLTLDYLLENYSESSDPYTLALCGHVFQLLGKQDALKRVLAKLGDQMQNDPAANLSWWSAKGEGITHGRGIAFDIETTALIAHLYLEAGHEISTAHQALSWLIENKDSRGTWHSTQATVLAMRSLLKAATATGVVEGDVELTIRANGLQAERFEINQDNADVFHLVSLSEFVQIGRNEIAIEVDQEANLAYQIVAVHHQPHQDRGKSSPPILSIDTDYSTVNLASENELTVTVTLRYDRPEFAPMTLVDLGVPPGFEIVSESLAALVQQEVISKYTQNGRQVSLYFASIPGGGKETRFKYKLKAKYPVKVLADGATAYQYYEPEVRDSSTPLQLEVK